jgi:F-type H+-transporting ATPase subunit epsilon
MRLKVYVLTPENIAYVDVVDELILQTSSGQVGVLSGHTPLLTTIDIRLIIFRRGSVWTSIAMIGGVALLNGNQSTILVNEVEVQSSATERALAQSLDQAIRRLNQALGDKEKERAIVSFKRARAIYQLRRSIAEE